MSKNIKLRPYIIYLEQNLSRLNNVQQLLRFDGARIFPAVDGRLVNFQNAEIKDEKSEQKTSACFIHFGSHLFPHRPEIRGTIKGLRLGYNEAGCLLSHFYLWCHLASTLREDEVALIMEDDSICDDPAAFLQSLDDLPPLNTWDLCQLFTTSKILKSESVSKGFFKSSANSFNRASAYLLTSNGCRAIINNSGSLDLPADDHLCLLAVRERLRVIFPEKSVWNHMERAHGWNSSLWDSENAYLNVQWNRPQKSSWMGLRLGFYTGIANQMFQWAAAKVQSLRLGSHLIVEAGPQCSLQLFPYIRDWQEWIGPSPDQQSGVSLRSRHALSSEQWKSGKEWNEKNLDYDPTIEDLTDSSNWKLGGYLQNLKYFEQYLPLLRMVFAFDEKVQQSCRDFLYQETQKLSKDRQLAPRIAVHLRLPNLSNEPFENSCYACPTHAFVYAAMDKMISMFPNAHFIMCSNDPGRCRSVYDFSKWSVSWAELGMMEDMAVMSMCDHFILSASTYGWWAAMLADNPEKKVIMSKPFFGPHYENLNEHHNILLPGWIVYDMKKNCFE